MAMESFWTRERIALLKQHYGTRKVSETAAIIGCTRDAAIGKAQRLKLRGRYTNGRPTQKRTVYVYHRLS